MYLPHTHQISSTRYFAVLSCYLCGLQKTKKTDKTLLNILPSPPRIEQTTQKNTKNEGLSQPTPLPQRVIQGKL